MNIEPIPSDCFPPEHVVADLLRGPDLDADGKIVGGLFNGLTPDEVAADKRAFERSGEQGLMKFVRKFLKEQ